MGMIAYMGLSLVAHGRWSLTVLLWRCTRLKLPWRFELGWVSLWRDAVEWEHSEYVRGSAEQQSLMVLHRRVLRNVLLTDYGRQLTETVRNAMLKQ